MDTHVIRLLERGQLEERRVREKDRIKHIEARISQFDEMCSDAKASEVYKTEIAFFRSEAEDFRASVAALNGALELIKAETEAQDEEYDDADRQDRLEAYEQIVQDTKECMKRDAMIMRQCEREISRLSRGFGSLARPAAEK